jgi:hypothetical protein|tara:strand:- start:927 stop:1481 length:555 start_codon:yes stop_codon:yes gene_type:complete
MIRDYTIGVSENVKVFSGKEVEHTPAYGLQTLFLARNDLTYDQIKELCVKVDAEAVYFGANRCFVNNLATQPMQVNRLLNDGYYVTIDYQYAIHNEVKKRYSAVWQHEKFIPFCSVIFENSEEDNKLCFKIDDVDFNTSNKGVWTMNMEDFKKQAGYTTWDEYKQDKPIEEKEIWPTVVSAQSS